MREAVERIRVIREDGTALAAGKRVRIEVDVRAGYIPADTLELYHSANGTSAASFTNFAALKPTDGAGPYQTLSAEFVLPAGNLQAIRARMQSNVDLYHPQCRAEDGETLTGTDTAAPFSMSWNSKNGPNGSRTLTARARDLAGNVSSSPPVTVTASNDLSVPVVTLTSPAEGSRLTRYVEFAADATDPEGVTRADFYSDERLIASDATAPFHCVCDTGITGTSRTSLTARAHDASGNVGISAPVVVNEGVAKVEFYVDGTLLGTDTSAPYEPSWDSTPLADGAHVLSAKAYGPLGIPSTSPSVGVTVDNNVPAAALTSPGPGAFLRGFVTLAATSSDTVGVTRIEFHDGATLLGTGSTAPYSMNWNTASATNGAHTLTVKAFDGAGNVTTSAGVAVTLDNTSPTVALGAPAYNASAGAPS